MFLDSILDWVVVALPTLLSLIGVLVTLEPWNKKHRLKWRVGLVLFGILVSTLTYWQQARQRSSATRTEREFRQEAMEQERLSAEKLAQLNEDFNLFALRYSQSKNTTTVRVPTAEEIAAAVGKELRNTAKTEHQTEPPDDLALLTRPSAPISPPGAPLGATKASQCRRDSLSESRTDELLRWGEPLISRVEIVEAQYMSDLKQLDNVSGGNWFTDFIGIGGKDSKWLKAYSTAQESAADGLRDCCAGDVLLYHQELLKRSGGGSDKTAAYEWVADLLKSRKSKENRQAREDAGRIIDVLSDLRILQIQLNTSEVIAHQTP